MEVEEQRKSVPHRRDIPSAPQCQPAIQITSFLTSNPDMLSGSMRQEHLRQSFRARENWLHQTPKERLMCFAITIANIRIAAVRPELIANQ